MSLACATYLAANRRLGSHKKACGSHLAGWRGGGVIMAVSLWLWGCRYGADTKLEGVAMALMYKREQSLNPYPNILNMLIGEEGYLMSLTDIERLGGWLGKTKTPDFLPSSMTIR